VATGIATGATAVVAFEIEPPIADFVTQAFVRSDSGDLVGYRAEVVKLAGRHVAPSGRTEEQLASLYNDASQQVYENLGKPIHDRVKNVGLGISAASARRSLNGPWPPGYGGGASCPRWRMPGHDGAWLEASIGVGHRAWPRPSLDNLIVTLMIAIMTDQAQHTLLTRFVPIIPDDPALNAKIEAILADVDAILPIAVELLASA
jgi:hypothetical protein